MEEEEECFKKGAIVEVCLEDEGFRGSWYTATVARKRNASNIKNNKIFLQFHTLMADDECTKPLKEFVNILLVRPVPPREPITRRFHLGEEVDAFQNDGWWEGIITEIIHPNAKGDDAASSSSSSGGNGGAGSGGNGGAGSGEIKYSVFFRCSREQLVFSGPELRLHREWNREKKWDPPLEEPQEQPPPAAQPEPRNDTDE